MVPGERPARGSGRRLLIAPSREPKDRRGEAAVQALACPEPWDAAPPRPAGGLEPGSFFPPRRLELLLVPGLEAGCGVTRVPVPRLSW